MGNGASVNQNESVAMEQSPLLATYELLQGYTYSETHKCYANGGIIPGSIPEPKPPSVQKTCIFNHVHYAGIDAKACQVDSKYIKLSIPKLVRYLTKDVNDTMSKVRIIFRWITAQPLEQLVIPEGEPVHDTVLYQFWRIKNHKGNYAQLFGLLCSFAQIPSIIISGRLKGSSYKIGETLNDVKHYGEWNAVLIDGYWRLLNVFWGACAEGANDDDKKLVYCCDENYFLTDPDKFIYTHFPDEQSWQLLESPLKLEEFTEQALLKDRFFDMNLKLNYPPKCVVYPTSEGKISFELPRETQANLWFLALLSAENDNQRSDLKRFVFVERVENHEIRIRVRNPGYGKYKLEIVGKDETRRDANYNFDWVAIYQIIFNTAALSPFPICPEIGWGPGNRSMFECGLTAVSHSEGEINTETGSLEITFKKRNNTNMKYWGEIEKNGHEFQDSFENHMVHRVENDTVIFNLETPMSGEYALKIHATNEEGIVTNICNYMIVSSQNKNNIPFPKDLQEGLGARKVLQEMEIEIVTPESPFIVSHGKEVAFEFKKPPHIQFTAFVTSDDTNIDSPKPKIKQTTENEKVIYRVKPQKSGNYSFRLRAVRQEGALPESIYDAVIKFTKVKKAKKKVEVVPQKAEEEKQLNELPDEIKSRIEKALMDKDDKDLELIIEYIKLSNLPSKEEEINKLQFEIEVIRCRKALVAATRSKRIQRMETALQSTYGKEYAPRLEIEITALKAMLERSKMIARLLRDVMALKQHVISEIKSYTKPPPVVHRVMIAALLLLGYNEKQTEDWLEVQKILGGTVRASIMRKVSKFDIDKINPEVARNAKDFVSGITLDDVRLISAGAATFYHWVKGVTDEIEKRRSEEDLDGQSEADGNETGFVKEMENRNPEGDAETDSNAKRITEEVEKLLSDGDLIGQYETDRNIIEVTEEKEKRSPEGDFETDDNVKRVTEALEKKQSALDNSKGVTEGIEKERFGSEENLSGKAEADDNVTAIIEDAESSRAEGNFIGQTETDGDDLSLNDQTKTDALKQVMEEVEKDYLNDI